MLCRLLPRVQASWLLFHLVDPLVVPQPLAVLLQAVVLLRRPRRRPRKRVCLFTCGIVVKVWLLTIFTDKEESDEDMGFGLFD